MARNEPARMNLDHNPEVDTSDRSAPIKSWIADMILSLSIEVNDGITISKAESVLDSIKFQDFNSNLENASAYVIFIQRLLNDSLGNELTSPLRLDSELGPATRSAIKQFQRKVKENIGSDYSELIAVDGDIGPQTIHALLSYNNDYSLLKTYLDRIQAQDIDLADGEIPVIFQNLGVSASFDSLTFLPYFSQLESEQITDLFSGVEHIMLTGDDLYLRYNLIKRMKDNIPSLKRVNFNCNYDTHEDFTTDDLGGLELCFYKSLPQKYSLGSNAKVLFQPDNLNDLLEVLNNGRKFDIQYFLNLTLETQNLTLNIDTPERLDRFISFLSKVYYPEGDKFSLPFDISVSTQNLFTSLKSSLDSRFPLLDNIILHDYVANSETV